MTFAKRGERRFCLQEAKPEVYCLRLAGAFQAAVRCLASAALHAADAAAELQMGGSLASDPRI